MEFGYLIVFALLCLTLRGTHASQSAKDYWHSVWPNTHVPEPLLDLVSLSYNKTNMPIKVEEQKQYWTIFLEHDLHPHKIINLGLHKHSDIQPSTSESFGILVWSKLCGKLDAIGEDKFCATSLESMIGFAISKLGKDIKVISSSFAPNQDKYIVEEVNKVGEKAVMCHRMNSENVVFYCHQINATTTYMVPLVSSDGTKAKALTVCHHDTRGMDPNVLHEVLKIKPGTLPVCHFVGNKAIAWVPNLVTSESNHSYVV